MMRRNRPVRRRAPPASSAVVLERAPPQRPASPTLRSSTATERERRRAVEAVAVSTVPIEIVDYRVPPPPWAQPTHVRRTPEIESFWATPIGVELKLEEKTYADATRDVIKRLRGLNEARVLFLGSGASAHLLSYAVGPRSMTFVDSSPGVINRLDNMMRIKSHLCEISCIVSKAGEYIRSCREQYDIIVATKCLGGILHDFDGEAHNFTDEVARLLAPAGILVVDEHKAFTTRTGTIGANCAAGSADYSVATINGRFADDLCYGIDFDSALYSSVLCWSSSDRDVQGWRQYVLRRHPPMQHPPSSSPALSKITARHMVVSTTKPPNYEVSELIPPSTRGRRVILTPSEAGAYLPTAIMPKFDGVGGVGSVSGTAVTFMSPNFSFTRRLPYKFPTPIHFSGEMVTADNRGEHGEVRRVLVVTGMCGLGTERTDPQSYRGLAQLRDLFSALSEYGIVVNTPAFMQMMNDRNLVVLPNRNPGDASLHLPCDGLNLVVGDLMGHFVKPYSLASVDVNLGTGSQDITLVHSWLRADERSLQMIKAAWDLPDNLVVECVADATNRWKVRRERPDKAFGSVHGQLLVDVASANAALVTGATGTLIDLFKYLTLLRP